MILIEADLRRPAISNAGRQAVRQGVISVLLESATLEDALLADDRPEPLAAARRPQGGWITELFALPSALTLIEDARRLADYVIIDSPPLTDVIDALPLAAHVDAVVMVVRLGQSVLRQTEELGQLLASAGVTPAGVAVVGVERRRRHYYYATDDPSASARRIVRKASAPAGGRNRGERAPVAGQRVGDDR